MLREKPTGVDAEQTAAFLALAAGHPGRTFLVDENFPHRNDLRCSHAVLDADVHHIIRIRLLCGDRTLPRACSPDPSRRTA